MPAVPAAAPAPAAADIGLLKFAPADSVAYLQVDFPKILDAPILKSFMPANAQIPDQVKQLDRMALFLGPPKAGTPSGTEKGAWTVVMKTKGTTLDQLRQELAAKGTKSTVEGTDVYTGQAPVQMMGPMGGAQQTVLIAPMDDATILVAPDEAGLTQAIQTYKAGSGGKQFAEALSMAGQFGAAAVTGGLVITDEMKAAAQGAQPMPAWLNGATGGALAVTLTNDLETHGLLRLATADEAQNAAAAATAKVNDFLQQMANPQPGNFMVMMAQPFRPVIEKLKFTADGADVHVSLILTAADVKSLADTFQKMQGAMGPPGTVGPPGTMGPPATMPPQP